MIGTRLAGGFLAAGVLAAATACGSAAEHASGNTRVVAVASQQPSETLTPLFAKALPNVKGKTFTSVIVTFPPSARAMPHRHGSAFVWAYVLEGSVRSRLAGEPVRTYQQGQNWFEQPGAHHLLTENASRTTPAKLLVVFVADTGAKLKVDDPKS